jgi:hypothetical protein
MKPEDRKRLKQHIDLIVNHKPICDGAYLEGEISVGVNNPDYYNQPSNSDVSMTQDVLTTIKTEGMFIVCQKCKGLIPPQAEKHIFNFCPACGRRIVRRI